VSAEREPAAAEAVQGGTRDNEADALRHDSTSIAHGGAVRDRR